VKYFGITQINDQCSTSGVVREGYPAYLAGILSSLPRDIQRLIRECILHDATLKRLDLLVADRTLVIELVGNHYAETLAPEKHIPASYARHFRLTYSGVQSFRSPGNPLNELPGPHGGGIGDLIHDEFELLGPGRVEHRILFSTGFEFHVEFADLFLWYQDFEFRQ
jgi:hypothetical protein